MTNTVREKIENLNIQYAFAIKSALQSSDEKMLEKTAKAFTNDIESLVEEEKAKSFTKSYLSKFSYIEWRKGKDETLRVGDYVSAMFEDAYSGGQTFIYGKIELHHKSGIPVFAMEDEYIDINLLWMSGYEFTRITKKEFQQDKN